jgi:hypothetical protein
MLRKPKKDGPIGRYETGSTPAHVAPSKRGVNLPTRVPEGDGTVTLEEYRRQHPDHVWGSAR